MYIAIFRRYKRVPRRHNSREWKVSSNYTQGIIPTHGIISDSTDANWLSIAAIEVWGNIPDEAAR
jgi:hypothetical protein